MSSEWGAVTYNEDFQINTSKEFEFIDITDRVNRIVDKSEISNGLIVVYALHTTAAIVINENEPLLLQDLEDTLKKIAPKEMPYRHNDFSIRTVNMCDDECKNGHSHCQHILLGPSKTIPLISNKMVLGKWQKVFLVELDRPRTRHVVVSILGTK